MSARRTALTAPTEPPAEAEPADVMEDAVSPASALAPTRRPSGAGVWVGLGIVAAGLALIILGWGLVAAELDLRDQLAPLVAAGIGGLAVVVIGLGVLNAAVARREEDDHRRQLAALVDVLEELRREAGR